MAAEVNLTEKMVKAQSIDLVTTFGQNIKKLMELLKLERELVLPMGSTIKTYTSKVTLDGSTVAKGDIIPLSKVDKEDGPSIELVWDKKRKAVAAEDIQKYGMDQALTETDSKLVREIQKNIKKAFVAQLEEGTTSISAKGLQASFAQAWGSVQTKFEDDDVTTVAFVNPMDLADYLADANITVQNAFGLKFIKDFMGVDIVVITTLVTAKKMYATAAQNLILAYAKMDGGEIAKVFDFTTDETGLLGVTHDINKQRLTAETVVASCTKLFAERLDGIVKVEIQAKGAK